MIAPTARAAVLAALGAPVALAAGLIAQPAWTIGIVWAGAVLILVALDARFAASRRAIRLEPPAAPRLAVGAAGRVAFDARFVDGPAPHDLEASLEAEGRLGLERAIVPAADEGETHAIVFPVRPLRRGPAALGPLRLRWRGPFGLARKTRVFDLDVAAEVSTDIEGVRQEALDLISRELVAGVKRERLTGEGGEFHALTEWRSGMERRAIDWKSSARHRQLLARELDVERNHQIILAIDAGRTMSEPVGGAPRLDRALHAALLLAWACLREGDKAGLVAFDDRPRVDTGPLSGRDAWRTLREVAARVDYGAAEANYTLALATLSGRLRRRSLIMIFTEITDETGARLLLETVGPLIKRHVVVFALLRDEELEALVEAEPVEAEDVARAVVARRLLTDRETVTARLRRLGAHVVEARADQLGAAAVNAWLDVKRRDLM